MTEKRLDLGAVARAARERVARNRPTTSAPPPPPPPEPPEPPVRRTPVDTDDEPTGSIMVRADKATWVRATDKPAPPTHLPPRSVRTRRAIG